MREGLSPPALCSLMGQTGAELPGDGCRFPDPKREARLWVLTLSQRVGWDSLGLEGWALTLGWATRGVPFLTTPQRAACVPREGAWSWSWNPAGPGRGGAGRGGCAQWAWGTSWPGRPTPPMPLFLVKPSAAVPVRRGLCAGLVGRSSSTSPLAGGLRGLASQSPGLAGASTKPTSPHRPMPSLFRAQPLVGRAFGAPSVCPISPAAAPPHGRPTTTSR